MTHRWRVLLATPLALPLTAGLAVLVDQPRNVVLPAVPAVDGTVVTVGKGDVVHRQPLGRVGVRQVERAIGFTDAGGAVAVGTTDQLMPPRITGEAADLLAPGDAVYCTAPRPTGRKRAVGLSEIRAIGMDLDAIRKLRHGQVQTCLVDRRSDGTVDAGFLADTSDRRPVTLVAIGAVPIRQVGTVPMPGESEARLVFDGPVGIVGNLSVTLSLVEEGQPLRFGDGQTIFRADALPRTVETLGGRFTILSYDKAERRARIRIDRPFAPGDYGVTTQITRAPPFR